MNAAIDKLLAHGCGGERRDVKVCRSRGGESCAFDGAMIVLQPIADAAHIVHGPINCMGNSWEGRGSLSRQGTLDRIGLTTDMGEMDIIYGAEGKLYEAVKSAVERLRPSAVFIYSTCISGLNGEDVEAVASKCARDFSLPVIPVSAPGFVGPKNLGNRIAGDALLEHVIGTGEPEALGGNEINLIGEYNIAGDLWLMEPLLEAAGIRVLSRITGDSTYREITWAHRARLNVMVCSRALINVAEGMKARWGMPYIEASMFGPRGVSTTLRLIAERLGNASIIKNVESVIEAQERRVAHEMKKYDHFRGKRAVVYSGGVKSWATVSALMDLGFEIVAVGTKKSTEEDERKIMALLGPNAPMEENVTPAALRVMMKDRGADLMVAGGRNLYLGAKEGFPFIDVNQERHSAYAGYDGFLNLARDIDTALRFYGERAPQAVIEATELQSSLVANPLKHSPAIGAAMVFQGIDRALPVLHGAQGCNFLGKVLLTKHFREPIALLSTKLFTEDVVMGSDEKLEKAIKDAARKQAPSIIGVIASALPAVKGEDTQGNIKQIAKGIDMPVALVEAPDFDGGLENGYVRAVASVIELLVEAGVEKTPARINILAGPHLTPEDFNEMREAAEAFGLQAIMLPDLSALDGSRAGFSALASGGVTVDEIKSMGGSAMTIAIGSCMEGPARLIESITGVPYRSVESITGLKGADRFMELLSTISGRPVLEGIKRRRGILVDAMRDAYLLFGKKRICLALEPSHLEGLSALMCEMGARISLAVIPQKPKYSLRIEAESFFVGDLSLLEEGHHDLIVSNSHAAMAAEKLGAPLYHAGFPAHKVMNAQAKATTLYRGTLNVLGDMSNLLMEVHRV